VREGDAASILRARNRTRTAMPAPSPFAADRIDTKGQVLTTLDAGYKRSRASEGPAGRAGGPVLADAPILDRTKARWTS